MPSQRNRRRQPEESQKVSSCQVLHGFTFPLVFSPLARRSLVRAAACCRRPVRFPTVSSWRDLRESCCGNAADSGRGSRGSGRTTAPARRAAGEEHPFGGGGTE